MQPDDARAARRRAPPMHEDGHVVGSGRLEPAPAAAVPTTRCHGPGRGQQDDDAHGEQDAEQEGGPRVEPPQHCAQPAHFTGLHDVARPIMRSFESWLSRVLSTQYSVPRSFQATMCRWSPW